MNQDPSNSKQSLSEISHLFLSSVRDRQTAGTAKPVRKPPTAAREVNVPREVSASREVSTPREMSIDLTPEEFAGVLGQAEESSVPVQPGRVSAIIGAHLNESSFDRVREYAGHLTADGSRIGLIECDSSIFRVMIFERNPNPGASHEQEPVSAEGFDARRMHEVLEELSWDVDHWLLLLPSPRAHEARSLLREIDHWVLLSTCDHDGVVSCYRTLKGLTDLNRPRISLALLDADDEVQAERVFQKLSSVSEQFLHCPLEAEAPVRRPAEVAEHLVLSCRATRDKAQFATAPQWQLVTDFVARSNRNAGSRVSARASKESSVSTTTTSRSFSASARRLEDEMPLPRQAVADMVIPLPNESPTSPASAVSPASVSQAENARVEEEQNDVIDLPEGLASPEAIVGAILRGGAHQLIECPVKPPMCPEASLAVGRDHRLTLIAVARQGLSDLRSIGQAYQWLIQNRALVAMAVPQFAIDAMQLPRLQLLIDQADLSAEILQPMLQSSNVTVLAYRKLRWAGRTGLLLNAA